MSIERDLLIMAQKIQDECMSHNNNCDDCPLIHNCILPEPYTWDIPAPPPEPTERPRIEWLRMLPDKELIMAMGNSMGCSKCDDEDDPNCYQGCADGVLPWWHEVVTLERFGKDVGLK